MYFVASKLFWLVFAPSSLLAILVLAAAAAVLLGYARAARALTIASAIFFILFGILPTGVLLIRPIENWYERPNWPAHVDGVLILSGGLNPDVLASRNVPALEFTESRLVSGNELARRYPKARIIFSGGSGALWGSDLPEAAVAAYIFKRQLGLPPDRLILESRSRNTWENIIYSKRIANPRPGEVWLLATSAFHMPRAMEAARKAGWKMVPWPTDYLTPRKGLKGFFDVPWNLVTADLAMHEWIGLLAYR